MAGHQSSPEGTPLVSEMRDKTFSFNHATLRGQVIFQEVTNSVTALAADRRMRLDAIGEDVPSFLWAALVGGGALIVSFMFLFGLPSTRATS